MAEAEVAVLKEALRKQTLLAKELYAELEEERKVAASGVEEALSMMTRLQEEKALAKLEASHLRRMAHEQMQHSEESMLAMNEVIFQKELEIQTFKYQVNCYKQKLSSIGIDIEFRPIKMDCYPSLRRGTFAKILDRNMSLPAVLLEELSSETDTSNKFESSSQRQNLLKPPISQPAHSNERITQFTLSREYSEIKSLSNGVLERTSSIDELKPIGDPAHLWYLNLSGSSLNLPQARDAWKRLKYGYFNRCVLRTRSDGDALCLIDSQDIDGHDFDETPNNLFMENLSETRYSSGETLGYLKCQNESNETYTSYYGIESTIQQKEEPENCPLLDQEPKNEVCPHPTENGLLKERIHWLDEYIKNMSQEDLERDAEEFKLLKSTIIRLDTKFKYEDDTMLSYLVEAMLYISI